MWLFRRKPSPEQQQEIEEYDLRFRLITNEPLKTWVDLLLWGTGGGIPVPSGDLRRICSKALVNQSDPVGVKGLIRPALDSAIKHRDTLLDAKAKLADLPLKSWFPKKLRKERESWELFIEYELSFIPMVIESLSPPDPLKMWSRDEKSKLNMFVQGMKLIEDARRIDVIARLLRPVGTK